MRAGRTLFCGCKSVRLAGPQQLVDGAARAGLAARHFSYNERRFLSNKDRFPLRFADGAVAGLVGNEGTSSSRLPRMWMDTRYPAGATSGQLAKRPAVAQPRLIELERSEPDGRSRRTLTFST